MTAGLFDPGAELARTLKKVGAAAHRSKLLDCFKSTRADGNLLAPYDWQADFFAAGCDHRQRGLLAANGIGKTDYVLCSELAMHLCGWYPPWWKGKRYKKPVEAVLGSPTNEMSRDTVQKYMLGPVGSWGTGWLPIKLIDTKSISRRQCSVNDCVDTVRIKHIADGWSTLTFKTYQQGRENWQGIRKEIIALDEQPPEDIWSEALTRGLARDWMFVCAFTPMLGQTHVSDHFEKGGNGVYFQYAGWDDAPHLTDEQKEQMLAAYPPHEREARSTGRPMQGHGAVYPVDPEELWIEPFPIPPHFRRIVGIDFGFAHPAAATWLALDADSDIVYVTDCYRKAGESSSYHAQAIRARGEWIPVSWPHDGMKTDAGSGIAIRDHYIAQHVNMLPLSARYDDEKAGAQKREVVIGDILDRMNTGRLRVFAGLHDWMNEMRHYHRDEKGKIVARRDDIMASTEYAMMMLRHARSKIECNTVTREVQPVYDPLCMLEVA